MHQFVIRGVQGFDNELIQRQVNAIGCELWYDQASHQVASIRAPDDARAHAFRAFLEAEHIPFEYEDFALPS